MSAVDRIDWVAAGFPDFAAAVRNDAAGRTAFVDRLLLAFDEAEQLADTDPALSTQVRGKLRDALDRFHDLEQRGCVDTFAPRSGPDGVLLPVFNPDDPDLSAAVFAFFAADPATLHVLRPGYTVEQVEEYRPLCPGTSRTDWDFRCGIRIEDSCDDYATRYLRVPCGNYLVLFAVCWGCSTSL
jgi:hypothetical protein